MEESLVRLFGAFGGWFTYYSDCENVKCPPFKDNTPIGDEQIH